MCMVEKVVTDSEGWDVTPWGPRILDGVSNPWCGLRRVNCRRENHGPGDNPGPVVGSIPFSSITTTSRGYLERGDPFFFSPANTAPTGFVGSPLGAAQGFAEAGQHELPEKAP